VKKLMSFDVSDCLQSRQSCYLNHVCLIGKGNKKALFVESVEPCWLSCDYV